MLAEQNQAVPERGSLTETEVVTDGSNPIDPWLKMGRENELAIQREAMQKQIDDANEKLNIETALSKGMRDARQRVADARKWNTPNFVNSAGEMLGDAGAWAKEKSQGLLGEAKNLFTDPRRMAMIRGGLALMDPNTYYDKQGFYSGMGGINRALGQASDTYQSLRKPFRDQEFELQKQALINRKPTGLMNEYTQAKSQGFPGDFQDYQKWRFQNTTAPTKAITQDGVMEIRPDGSTGRNYGKPFDPWMNYQMGITGKGQEGGSGMGTGAMGTSEADPSLSWVPLVIPSWENVHPKDRSAMMQADMANSGKYLREIGADLRKANKTAQGLQRFKYLNKMQPNTGSYLDRFPLNEKLTTNEYKLEMQKISYLLTPAMRQGMPGAASDRDVAMFRGATVGIENYRDVNNNVIKAAMIGIQNKRDRYKFMLAYRNRNNTLQGAEFKWQEYLEANPIFDTDAEEGSYTLNENRRTMEEYFKNPKAQKKKTAKGSGLTDNEKKRLEMLRKKKQLIEGQ